MPSLEWDGRELELVFRLDSKLYDGRFANSGWLQEFPDPMTKLTWDNAALVSLATAEKLGLKHEEVVKLKFKGREIEAPVYVMPGQVDGTVAVSLGYGRTAAGKVGGSLAEGIEPVGFNAYQAPHHRRHVVRYRLDRRTDWREVSLCHHARSFLDRQGWHGRPGGARRRTGARGHAGGIQQAATLPSPYGRGVGGEGRRCERPTFAAQPSP